MTNHIGHIEMFDDLNMLTPSVFNSSDTLPGSYAPFHPEHL